MKNTIGYLILLFFVSCIPIENKGDMSGKDNEFEVEPQGEWTSACHNSSSGVFKSKSNGKIVAIRQRAVFSAEEPTFSLVIDYLSDACKNASPTVAATGYINGEITWGNYVDLDSKMRSRRVDIEVSREYYIAKIDIGLEYISSIREIKSSTGLNQELSVDKRFSSFHGVLAMLKDKRNNMHIYLDVKKDFKNEDVKLVTGNLYVQTIRK